MQNITINTINWVNGRTRLNQTNMNNIEGNLNLIAFKVNELVDYANANPHITLATVATTGSYDDLIDKPSIPAAQVQSDWNQSDNTKADFIKNKPSIPTDTNDLTNGAGYITGSYVEANPATTTGTLTGLKVNGVSYAVPQGGMVNPMNAAGDLIVGGSSGTPVRLGKGSDGQALKMASGSPTWVDDSTGGSTVDIVGTAIVISDDE